MTGHRAISRLRWRAAGFVPRLLYRIGLGSLIGRTVLLLTTTGRKSGLPRSVPLQYEEVDGAIYCGSARGADADWFRNILANAEVTVRLGGRRFRGLARPVQDVGQVADFLELRLDRHPRMVGGIMRMAGLPSNPSRKELERYAQGRAVVVIAPIRTV